MTRPRNPSVLNASAGQARAVLLFSIAALALVLSSNARGASRCEGAFARKRAAPPAQAPESLGERLDRLAFKILQFSQAVRLDSIQADLIARDIDVEMARLESEGVQDPRALVKPHVKSMQERLQGRIAAKKEELEKAVVRENEARQEEMALVSKLKAHDHAVKQVLVGGNGIVVTLSSKGEAHVARWGENGPVPLEPIGMHKPSVKDLGPAAVTMSGNGELIAFVNQKTSAVEIYKTETGELVDSRSVDGKHVALSFSPAGDFLIVFEDSYFAPRVYELQYKMYMTILGEHNVVKTFGRTSVDTTENIFKDKQVTLAQFSPDASHAAVLVKDENALYVQAVGPKELPKRIALSADVSHDEIRALDFSPNGRQVLLDGVNQQYVVDLDKEKTVMRIATADGGRLHFLPDPATIALETADAVFVLDTRTGEAVESIDDIGEPITSMQVLPKGELLIATKRGNVFKRAIGAKAP